MIKEKKGCIKMINVQQAIYEMSKLAPHYLACDWDNVGLQIGDSSQKVNNILVTLDVTEAVVEEAIKKNCELIISHHPLIFNGLKSINKDNKIGKLIINAVNNKIAIYSAHTNLDIARGGLNDYFACLLGIEDIVPLKVTEVKKSYKLAVYIPQDHYQEVTQTMFAKGAGKIGNYSHSSFSTEGKSTFKPLSESNPYRGKKEEMNNIQEIKFETIVTEDKLDRVLRGLYDVHPYEDIAYDLYPLSNKQEKIGIGRIGELEKKLSLETFIKRIKEKLQLKTFHMLGNVKEEVKKIAFCTGAGSDYIETAKYAGADLYITGDVKFHEAQRAEAIGLNLIDAGHYKTEIIVKELLAEYLSKKLDNTDIIKSEINTNPWLQI